MWISGYVDIWISGYLDIWISGYLDIWISGYLDIWISRYLDTAIITYSSKLLESLYIISVETNIADLWPDKLKSRIRRISAN